MTLSVIILSYNTKALLRQCLRSVFNLSSRLSDDSLEIIVVDNASTDGSPEMVKAEFPQVKLIKSPQNLGFAAGNNLGLKQAQGKYLMLLNSDTEITNQQTFPKLINYLDTHPKAAVITPKVVLPSGQIDPACHRGMPTPWNAFTYFTGLEKLLPHSKTFAGYHQGHLDLNITHPIPATAATAIMVRRAAITQVGLLDESFFLYGEDLDWCQRFTDAGWQIIYYPQVTVLHHKSASGKKNASNPHARQASVDHFYDTMKLFYEKHYAKRYPKWFRRLIYLGIDLKKQTHKSK